MKELKKFIGGLVMFSAVTGFGCWFVSFTGDINGPAARFLWIAVLLAYCFGYGIHALDTARAWPTRATDDDSTTDREIENLVVRERMEVSQ